jgi:hypothetical protein
VASHSVRAPRTPPLARLFTSTSFIGMIGYPPRAGQKWSPAVEPEPSGLASKTVDWGSYLNMPADEWMLLPQLGAKARLSQIPGRGALGELALDHIGMAVYEVDVAIRRFTDLLGLHDWSRLFSNVPRNAMASANGQWAPSEFLNSRARGFTTSVSACRTLRRPRLGQRVRDFTSPTRVSMEMCRSSLLRTEWISPVSVWSFSLHGWRPTS